MRYNYIIIAVVFRYFFSFLYLITRDFFYTFARSLIYQGNDTQYIF